MGVRHSSVGNLEFEHIPKDQFIARWKIRLEEAMRAVADNLFKAVVLKKLHTILGVESLEVSPCFSKQF
ncbi:hypothetical protein Ldro_0093 [Legionella drozanskii LLAP-1]|uniref:Uncharacterized protein n=1 Tax=Legionella drozanskii LLAP-1 TaxID=1212489 RepID=A0A0W0TDQ7_9GAMM|nr:hypothetical protein Ldro_0093 [Legionella drozanskii LLAP-1]PJE13598.1 MAG: hypothetical protein CK430_06255 [Legionella sp.]